MKKIVGLLIIANISFLSAGEISTDFGTFGDWAQRNNIQSDATHVNGADYPDPGVSSLDGIESYTKIQNLTLYANTIEFNPNWFSDLSDLEYLKLISTRFTNIKVDDLTHLSNLKTLDLRANAISNIENNAFRNMQSLQYLDLSSGSNIEMNYNFTGANFRDLQCFIGFPSSYGTTVLFNNSTLSQTAYNGLMGEESKMIGGVISPAYGITQINSVGMVNFSSANLSDVTDLSQITLTESIEELIFDGTIFSDSIIAGDYSELLNLTDTIASLNKLTIDMDVYLSQQDYFDTWDAIDGNTLITPEPATLLLFGLGGLALRKRRA